MDKNERKKKMRKGLRIVGIVIAALLLLLLCVYWISQAMVEKEPSTPWQTTCADFGNSFGVFSMAL